MPKPRFLSRSRHLVKYTFPVIRSVINRMGAPREIGKVAPQQRGPLLVTLAMDISADCIREIGSSLEASAGGAYLPAKSLIPDLFEGFPVQEGSGGYLLLMKNARWWTEFSRRAEAKFRALAASLGPLRILLRSAVANAAANKLDGKKKRRSPTMQLGLESQKIPISFLILVNGLNTRASAHLVKPIFANGALY